MNAITITDAITREEFAKRVNQARLDNKNQWVSIGAQNMDGCPIALKMYGTWVQIFRCNEFETSNTMEMSVTEFKNWLAKQLALVTR
jgi:hypothetical protein